MSLEQCFHKFPYVTEISQAGPKIARGNEKEVPEQRSEPTQFMPPEGRRPCAAGATRTSGALEDSQDGIWLRG